MEPQVQIFVQREGLLARLGHDLQLSARQFEIRLQDNLVRGRFASDMLRVDGVIHRGRLDQSVLSNAEKTQIEQTVRDDILQSGKYPQILFEGTVQGQGPGGRRVEGRLHMVGSEQAIAATVHEDGGIARAEVVLTPSSWGIAPYRAMAGALRIKDRVQVVIAVPNVDRREHADVVGGEMQWVAAPG